MLPDWLVQIATRLRGYNPLEVVIELALIWTVVYLIFRFLRGTRGARVLKGFGLVVLVSATIVVGLGGDSQMFPRLQFLLGNFLTFAAFALLIVFQPELRRAMVRIGDVRIFRGGVVEMDKVIDEIVTTAESLSRNKVGAILAIEREVGLGGIVEAGTQLNANVSAPLLKTIFWPGTALHDMGVVIRGDKVVAAGVQFPLADSEDISQELGSRHRAALGLSQEADCLVLVVSEETGAISLAERGQLVRKLSPDGLRAMLRRALSPAPLGGGEAGEAEGGATPAGGSGGSGGDAGAEKAEQEGGRKDEDRKGAKADKTAA